MMDKFEAGDRVRRKATGELGTVLSCPGSSIEVRWDGDDGASVYGFHTPDQIERAFAKDGTLAPDYSAVIRRREVVEIGGKITISGVQLDVSRSGHCVAVSVPTGRLLSHAADCRDIAALYTALADALDAREAGDV